jgi:hypothetical protein
MLALYLATLGFGATMILVSLVLGAGDKDLQHDHDAHVDHDHDGQVDHDHDAQTDHEGHVDKDTGPSSSDWWMPLLSLRFWTFGSAAFGLAGTLLTLFGLPAIVTAIAATLLGLGMGTAAARVFAALRSDTVSGVTDLRQYAGEEGRVVLPIRPGAQGKIAVVTDAGRVELLARSADPSAIERGARVIVAAVDGAGVAEVERLPPSPEEEARARAVKSAAAKERTAQR